VNNGNGQKGWTLVEALIVVALVGLVALIVGPAFFDFLRRAKLDQAKMELVNSSLRARQRAIRTAQTHWVVVPTTLPAVGDPPHVMGLEIWQDADGNNFLETRTGQPNPQDTIIQRYTDFENTLRVVDVAGITPGVGPTGADILGNIPCAKSPDNISYAWGFDSLGQAMRADGNTINQGFFIFTDARYLASATGAPVRWVFMDVNPSGRVVGNLERGTKP